MKKERDVSKRANEFLFDTVAVDPAVTLADIFRLMHACPALRKVFRRDFANELFAEADKGAVEDPEKSASRRIEFLQLYERWSLDTGTNVYGPTHRLCLEGVGFVLTEDAPDYGVNAGDRIKWGLSTAPLRQLLTLPIRINQEVLVTEDDLDAKAYGQALTRVNHAGVSLGQVIHGLLWELSFHGGPVEQQAVVDSLKAQMAELDLRQENEANGPSPDVETADAQTQEAFENDFFDEPARPGCAVMFDAIGGLSHRDIRGAMRDIDDNQNMAQALNEKLGDSVVVKEAYRGLGARAFRKVFRTAAELGPPRQLR